jgi:hypothetical protein
VLALKRKFVPKTKRASIVASKHWQCCSADLPKRKLATKWASLIRSKHWQSCSADLPKRKFATKQASFVTRSTDSAAVLTFLKENLQQNRLALLREALTVLQ